MTYTDSSFKRYLLVSDFDQTLSFHDSGQILSELLGVSDFIDRVAGLEKIHLVQQGGELAYLLLHDPDFRRVRKEHLIEVGKRVRLKANIALLSKMLNDIEAHDFTVLRCIRCARGSYYVGARRYRRAGAHLRNTIPLQFGDRRDTVDYPVACRLWEGGRSG